MADTTSTTVAELIPNEVLQASRDAFQKDAMLPGLVRVADLSNRPGKAAEFPAHVAVSITKPAAETTDVTTDSAIDPTSVTLTVVRRTARVDISDLARGSSVEDLNATAGRLIGKARSKQVDTDLCAQMGTDFTTSVGATNATTITPENILTCLLNLKVAEADDNLVLAIHPKQEAHILDDLVVTSSTQTDQSALGQSAMSDGGLNRKSLFGFLVLSTARVATGTDTNDMYLGFAFNAQELGYAVKNIAPGIEIQRDASIAQNEVIMNYYDSVGRLRDAAFVLLKSQTY